eukprot:TRINITY_DN1122_c0_g1_i1.p2 TRINITY_DN1122_c0_g1~~TRINITY_DN1122_c0_g1_i1.p2  ORF type:complete len:124 (-),score=22.47 TRINITY_DN1122_c0_g1_i1:564-935(-)
MAQKEGVPPCCSADCCLKDWKALSYDKKNIEGTWVQEGGSMCCGKVSFSPHCMCYTGACFYCMGIPMCPDLTWTCGDNCWVSQGGNTWIYGEGDVLYHQYMCCPFDKWTKVGASQAPGQQEMQ